MWNRQRNLAKGFTGMLGECNIVAQAGIRYWSGVGNRIMDRLENMRRALYLSSLFDDGCDGRQYNSTGTSRRGLGRTGIQVKS